MVFVACVAEFVQYDVFDEFFWQSHQEYAQRDVVARGAASPARMRSPYRHFTVCETVTACRCGHHVRQCFLGFSAECFERGATCGGLYLFGVDGNAFRNGHLL